MSRTNSFKEKMRSKSLSLTTLFKEKMRSKSLTSLSLEQRDAPVLPHPQHNS